MNIELHIEKVQSLLDQMDLQKKCKFAAWCCNALIIEKKINENIHLPEAKTAILLAII